jgi:hypothetical protein
MSCTCNSNSDFASSSDSVSDSTAAKGSTSDCPGTTDSAATDLGLNTDDRVRVLGWTGSAFYLAKTQWCGEIDGTYAIEDRFAIVTIAPDQVVHYLNRVLSVDDLSAVREFLSATIRGVDQDLIPDVTCETAGLQLSVTTTATDDASLVLAVVHCLCGCPVDTDTIYLQVKRGALQDACDVLDRWLVLDAHVPNDLSQIGSV